MVLEVFCRRLEALSIIGRSANLRRGVLEGGWFGLMCLDDTHHSSDAEPHLAGYPLNGQTRCSQSEHLGSVEDGNMPAATGRNWEGYWALKAHFLAVPVRGRLGEKTYSLPIGEHVIAYNPASF